MNYSFFNNTGYILGNGSLESLKEIAFGKVALVVDSRIITALGLEDKLYNGILKDMNCKIICDIQKEPTMEMIDSSVEAIKDFEPDNIVAIGGGSVMDAAKALWLFYELPDYTWDKATVPFAVDKFPGKASLIVVPTTSGTGSETTGCSVIKGYDNSKQMILSNEILPTKSIMDYDLLCSIPQKNIAYSGTDALAHAFEAAVSQLSSTMVKRLCCEACVTILKQLPKSYKGDMTAREEMHVAATLAGAGINNSITGMAHGMDSAGGDFALPHGLVTGMLLPYTMSYLAPNPFYEEVAERMGFGGTSEEKQQKLIDYIFNMYSEINMPKSFLEIGVDEKEYLAKIPKYIERAKTDNNIVFAPKKPTEEELERLFKKFYYGRDS